MEVFVVLWETDPDYYQVLGVYAKEQDAKFYINHMIENSNGRYDIWDFEVVKSTVQ